MNKIQRLLPHFKFSEAIKHHHSEFQFSTTIDDGHPNPLLSLWFKISRKSFSLRPKMETYIWITFTQYICVCLNRAKKQLKCDWKFTWPFVDNAFHTYSKSSSNVACSDVAVLKLVYFWWCRKTVASKRVKWLHIL